MGLAYLQAQSSSQCKKMVILTGWKVFKGFTD